MPIKPTIENTQIGINTAMKIQMKEAVSFLLQYYNMVAVENNDLATLKSLKNFSNSTISKLFTHIIETEKLNKFICFDYSRLKDIGIPELLTLSAITIDGSNNHTLPRNLQKIWCNITPYIRKRASISENIIYTDVNRVHELFVRGALCKVYSDTDTYLNSDISTLLIESYALTITGILSTAYNLTSLQDRAIITILFACFFAQRVSIGGSMEIPEILHKCKRLYGPNTGADITMLNHFLQYKEDRSSMFTIYEVCKIISEHGPSRMKTFTVNHLNSLFSRGSAADTQIMLIALEYPPYYLTQLLLLADNYKNYTLASNHNNKKYAQALAEKLITCREFIPAL